MKRIRGASDTPPGVALQCGVFCRTRRQIVDWCSAYDTSFSDTCCVKHLPVITSTDKTYILFVVTYDVTSQIKMTEFRSIDFWVWLMFVSFWDRKMCQSRDFVIPPPSCYCCTSCSKKTKRPNEFYSTFCSGKQRLWLDGAVTYSTELVTFVADQVSYDYNGNLCNLTQITLPQLPVPVVQLSHNALSQV